MSYDRLKPFRKIYSYGQLNQTERDLRKKGLIIRRMMSRLTEFGREVAEFKILDYFIPHLKTLFSTKPEPKPEKPKKVRNTVDERDSLLIDMLQLVSYVAKNEVHMTSSWEFPRREIDHIKQAMSKTKDDRFELVQKFARKVGAYTIGENDRVIPANVNSLFAGRHYHVARRLLKSQLGRTRAIWATPDQPTEYTLNLAICRLRESVTEEWIGIEELRDWIRSELFIDNQQLKWIQVDNERVQLSLETPILLGIVEAAYRGKKLLGVRLTDVGADVLKGRSESDVRENGESFFVLPNFELTVFTSEMEFQNLYRLMLITEPIRTDVVSTFKISDTSVFQAIEIGLREDDLLGFLEKESSKPIPRNVVRSITDWTSQTTFTTVEDVTLFETENEKDMEKLMLIPAFTKAIVRKIGPTAVVVSGDMEKFSDSLRKHKCMVRRKQQADESEVTETSSVAEHFLLYSEEETVEDVPEPCEDCPAVQSCSKMIRRKGRVQRSLTN